MISVLLVDDEPALLDVAQIFLEMGGTMKVTLSESGYNALQVLKSGDFDIIVSDYEMPGMNGIDLLKTVKSDTPEIPFIIFTGRGREHVAIEALNYGASFYLQKGGDPKSQFAELKNLIEQAVNRKKAEEEVKLNESRLSAIIDLYRMTSATQQEFSNYALEKAIELTKSRIGYLSFLNEDETVLTMYAWSRQALDECRISNKPIEYAVKNTGLWGEAVRQRRAVITNDYAAANPLKKGCPDGHVHLIRHMNVPVFDGSRIVMVAGVGNKQHDYDSADVTQITLLMRALWQIIKENRAENELRSEKKRLQSYFDHPLVGIVTTSPAMKWLSGNEKFCSIFGYSRDEVADRSWTDITLPGDLENEKKTYELIISGELQDKTLRKKYLRNDGTEISVEVSSMPVRNEAGEVDYIVSFVQDISGLIRTQEELVASNLQMARTLGELKATQASLSDYIMRLEQEEKSLKESEERYRSLVENISAGIFRASATDGWELQCSSMGFLRMLGYDTRDSLNGTPFFKLFSDEREFTKLSDAVSAGGVARGYETVLKKNDGVTIPVQVTAILKQNDPETPGWIDVIVEDLTGRKVAEEAIRENEEKFRNIVETAPSLLTFCDINGINVYVSPNCQTLTGFTTGELKTSIIDWVYEDDRERVDTQLRDIFRKRCGGRNLEYRGVKKDGGTWYASTSWEPLSDKYGHFSGFVMQTIDITGKKEAEVAREEYERKYHDVLNNLPDIIYIADNSGNIVFMNKKGLEAFEVTGEEMINQPFTPNVHPDDLAEGVRIYQDVISRGNSALNYECRFVARRGKGRVFPVIQNVTPVFDKSGNITGSQGIALDISEKKKAEDALRKSEERLKMIAEQMPGTLWTTDTALCFTSSYGAGLGKIGLNPNQVVGLPLHEFYHGHHGVDIAVEMHKRALKGESVEYGAQFNGRVFSSHVEPLRSADGTIIGTLGVAFDITEQKMAENALFDAEATMRTFFNTLPEAAFLIDTGGRLLLANEAFIAEAHLEPDSIPGKDIFGLISPEQADAVKQHLRMVVSDGKPVVFEEKKNNKIFMHALYPVRDEDGNVSRTAVIITDVTGRKNAEEAISMMNRKLTLLGRMTRHDVNNRLSVLSGYLDLTREIVDDPRVLSYIRKEERAVTAIMHLLNFAGSYQDVGMKEPSWQDVADAVRKSAYLLELRYVTVYLDICGLEVYADPLFEKVFYNLIENALEYGKKISKILISASESGECLTIMVEDDGVGIAESEKERIFEPGVGQNTGYGLFLVREILSMTGFSIREVGVQNAGAKFEIKIPAGYYRFTGPAVPP